MEAAPVGKLYVRDPDTGEVSLIDADPVTVDSSAALSGLADASDPEHPVAFEGGEEAADVAVGAPAESSGADEPAEDSDPSEGVEEPSVEVAAPAPRKRAPRKKAPKKAQS